VKSYLSEVGHDTAQMAVQVYGGHGYIRENGAGVTDKMLASAGWSNRSLTSKTPRGFRCFGVETSRPRTDASGRGVVACNGSRETGSGIGSPGDRWSAGGKAVSWRGTKPREVTGLAHRQR